MKNFLIIIIGFSLLTANAQISQSIVNKNKFEKSGFPFKGNRVLMVDNVSSKNEDHYFVFSKNDKTSEQEALYIEQFTKENGKWLLKVSDLITEKDVVTSVWDNRKSFSDINKDGKIVALFIYSKHQKGKMDNQLTVVQLLFHQHKIYSITSMATTNYTEDIFSENFKDLTDELKNFALSFWNRIDK